MKWLKPHPIIGQFRIVRKFPLLPIHTDDGYMVWLETVWAPLRRTAGEAQGDATELFAARKEIETLKSELALAHKMHDVAVKEWDYERFLVKCLMEELNRKS